jgi:hypothetical protein
MSLSTKTPAKRPMAHAIEKYTIRVRTKIAAAKMVFKTTLIKLRIVTKSLEIPLPIELNKTPKSISSLSLVFLDLDVLIFLIVFTNSTQMQNGNSVLLFY